MVNDKEEFHEVKAHVVYDEEYAHEVNNMVEVHMIYDEEQVHGVNDMVEVHVVKVYEVSDMEMVRDTNDEC